jgi:glycine cleavage system H protein
VRINEALTEHPEQINDDPYREGWMMVVRLSNPAEIDGLLSAQDYLKHLEGH